METSTILVIGIGVVTLAIVAYAIYISFGPPAAELQDPFDDHED